MITPMLTFRLPPLRLILPVLLGSIVILGGAIAGVVALWQPRSLEAMLPGKDVIALFSNVTREDLRGWNDRFPELKDVPVFDGRLELGIVEINEGSRGWILSSPMKDVPLPNTNGNYRGQDVLLSRPDVMGRMTGSSPRLRDLESFHALQRGVSPAEALVYLTMTADRATGLLPSPLRPFLHASGSILLSTEGSTVRLRLLGMTTKSEGTIAATIPPLTPEPDMTLSLAAPQQMLEQELSAFPGNDRVIRKAQLSKKIQEALGGEWSMDYDILPLLEKPSTLSLRSGTGAIPSFVFRGTMSDLKNGRRQLSAFHENAQGQLSGTAVTRRAFDRGFTSAIIGSAPSQVQKKAYSLLGWTVQETVRGDGRVLLTAARGRDFVIANEKGWFESVLEDEQNLTLPTILGLPIAGGRLSPAMFMRFTEDVRGTPEWTALQSGIDPGKGVLWGVERDGKTLTLSIRQE